MRKRKMQIRCCKERKDMPEEKAMTKRKIKRKFCIWNRKIYRKKVIEVKKHEKKMLQGRNRYAGREGNDEKKDKTKVLCMEQKDMTKESQ
jgi:hypothetical protein